MQRLERVVLIILFLLATGAGQAFSGDPTAFSRGEGQPVTQVAFGLLYLALILMLIRYRTAAVRLVLQEKWLALVCVWALASVMWSAEPGESLRRALALIGTSIAGLYLGMRYEPKEQLRMTAFVLGIGAAASFLVVLFLPSVGFTPDGFVQGVYNLKNSLGRMMALGAMCFALLALSERKGRALRVLMFLLCVGLLIASKSATAVVVTLLMLALLPMRRLLYLPAKKLAFVMAVLAPILIAGLIWAVDSADELLLALGRTSSLTGRIPLWQQVLKAIADHPIRGYGFTAFWNSWAGQRVSDSVNWDAAVPHAHNGFLEVWLGLGIVGLGMMLINMARDFVRGIRAARSHPQVEYAWPLMMVVFTILYNLTENSLLAVNAMPWMAYGAISYWLTKAAREEQLEGKTLRLVSRQPDEAEAAEIEPAYSS